MILWPVRKSPYTIKGCSYRQLVLFVMVVYSAYDGATRGSNHYSVRLARRVS